MMKAIKTEAVQAALDEAHLNAFGMTREEDQVKKLAATDDEQG